MSKSTAPTIDQVAAILNHDRTRVAWVCAVVDGKIAKIARILTRYPRDGAGRLTVCVSDWGPTGQSDGGPKHYIGHAGGFGYDKFTACTEGATVGGIELGDHCDHKGRPILREVCRANGWEVIGDDI